jgi:chitin deacetylase
MRRTYIIGGVGLAVIAILYFAWTLSSSRTFQLFGEIVPRVNTSAKIVALTFDDGPAPEATEQVLSILRERNVKATFFVIGAELEQHPELGKALASEGHELGNHSYSHKRFLLKTPSFIKEEIERTDRLIRDTGYAGVIHFRPPYGKKLALLPYYLSKTGRKTIMCDVEPDSYPDVAEDADKIVDHVMARARPGSVILLHVMYERRIQSLRAVAGIIDRLKQEGFEFKTVSDLLSSN